MRPFPLFISAAFLTAAFPACTESISTGDAQRPDLFAGKVDSTVKPSDDFFQFVNGMWFHDNPVPASEKSWGIGHVVQQEIYARLRKINDDASKAGAAEGTGTQKIGDFWLAGMDSSKADQMGIQPLEKELKMISDCKTRDDVVAAMIRLEPLQIGIFYAGFYVTQDPKHSEEMTVMLWQGGLGLPDREYYSGKDSANIKIRDAYVAHISKMLSLSGTPAADAEIFAQKVFDFESSLAANCRRVEDLRHSFANYHKMATEDVTAKLTSLINWNDVCNSFGIKADSIVVGQPEFFKALNKSIRKTPVEVLRAYMQFHLVSAYATYLSKEIDTEHFNFEGRVLSGTAELRPRWKRVLDSEDDAMGMLLGKLFVEEYFPAKTKARYTLLVEEIRAAYAERIRKLDWMSDSTKNKALDKLAKMSKKVGYPDKWKDYSSLVISRNSYCENMMHASRWDFNEMTKKFGKPVDRTEWEMNPQTYNAYYNPSNNEIVLPAAIFTIPGIPDSLVDDAVVYGYAAASTIGHEITHGFDDDGRNYDGHGNLVNWWSAEDSLKFGKRAMAMVRQFESYEPLPGKHINGKATLGENIADYGGVLLGLDAFRKTEQYKRGEKIDGYTPMQRYFMGYTLGWLYHQREKELARRLITDVHAPAKWRVNGPFANIPEFYEAFNVKAGDPMWREDSLRVSIW